MSYTAVANAIKHQANPEKAAFAQRFFRTGKGEYGEGDVFLGLTVPQMRTIAKQHKQLPLKDIARLLKSKYHEFRLTALHILVYQYEKANEQGKKERYDFYMQHLGRVNNWDLVDSSAHKIVGDWLLERDKKILYKLAKSKTLWERLVAIVATGWFIRSGKLQDTFALSELLVDDSEDLMHKAVGWMLREAGKKDVVQLEKFLKKHYKTMPRTMLRYSIEKFPEKTRKMYIKGLI